LGVGVWRRPPPPPPPTPQPPIPNPQSPGKNIKKIILLLNNIS